MLEGDKPREKCGVVGIATDNASLAPSYLYYGLRALQHRGQESAGMAVEGKKIKCVKDLGLVSDVFDPKTMKKLKGKAGIGHVYYSQKLSKPENAQPHVISTSVGEIALGHNGIIVNAEELKRELRIKGHVFLKGTEEEAMAYIMADEMQRSNDILKAIKVMMRNMLGSYTLTMLYEGRVFGIRDPYGIRPLCVGKMKDGHAVVSESVALDVLEAKPLGDVQPGEVVELTPNGVESHQMITMNHKAHCFFEYVYFARADSVIEGRNVYEVRERAGSRCAKEHPVDADVVIPIPDSGRSHAYGFSHETDLPVIEGLMKNRYIGRTFIMPDQESRDISVREKVNPIVNVIKGKKVVLVDDSIVRGTTMTRIVQAIKGAGAKEVHVRIGSPPLITPCYLGIDMTTRERFLANAKTMDDIRDTLTADSIGYISVDGVVDAIGLPKGDLCLGCVTGKYPLDIPSEMHRFQKLIDDYEEEDES
ncbi:MAG: amidophosphoribosyltransferase [Thermoplasmata archaeon]